MNDEFKNMACMILCTIVWCEGPAVLAARNKNVLLQTWDSSHDESPTSHGVPILEVTCDKILFRYDLR